MFSEGSGGRACGNTWIWHLLYLTRRANPPEAPSNSFCLCIFGPAGSHDHPYLEGGWTEDWWTRCGPWLTVLPQALKAANASEEDTFPEPRSSRTTSHMLEAGSVEGRPRCAYSHLSCHCPTPPRRGPGGPVGASKSSFPAYLWASLTLQWADTHAAFAICLSVEKSLYMCILNTQNFPKTPGLAFVLAEGASSCQPKWCSKEAPCEATWAVPDWATSWVCKTGSQWPN